MKVCHIHGQCLKKCYRMGACASCPYVPVCCSFCPYKEIPTCAYDASGKMQTSVKRTAARLLQGEAIDASTPRSAGACAEALSEQIKRLRHDEILHGGFRDVLVYSFFDDDVNELIQCGWREKVRSARVESEWVPPRAFGTCFGYVTSDFLTDRFEKRISSTPVGMALLDQTLTKVFVNSVLTPLNRNDISASLPLLIAYDSVVFDFGPVRRVAEEVNRIEGLADLFRTGYVLPMVSDLYHLTPQLEELIEREPDAYELLEEVGWLRHFRSGIIGYDDLADFVEDRLSEPEFEKALIGTGIQKNYVRFAPSVRHWYERYYEDMITSLRMGAGILSCPQYERLIRADYAQETSRFPAPNGSEDRQVRRILENVCLRLPIRPQPSDIRRFREISGLQHGFINYVRTMVDKGAEVEEVVAEVQARVDEKWKLRRKVHTSIDWAFWVVAVTIDLVAPGVGSLASNPLLARTVRSAANQSLKRWGGAAWAYHLGEWQLPGA